MSVFPKLTSIFSLKEWNAWIASLATEEGGIRPPVIAPISYHRVLNISLQLAVVSTGFAVRSFSLKGGHLSF